MTMSQPDFRTLESERAPACFGSPSCYAMNSKICSACGAHAECGEEVKNTLVRIKSVINIDDLLHKHNQAMEKARLCREISKKEAPLVTLKKPQRRMPKSVERKSKVEKMTYEINDATQALIEILPVKAQPFAVQLCRSGMIARIKNEIKTGSNPLEKMGPKFLALALKMLIEEGFSKSGLRGQYVKAFQWTESTAASHVSLTVKLFIMFEIAIETADGFVVNPKLLSETN